MSGAYRRAVEYVEVARSESERGELVLRERRPGPADAGAGPTVLELRANGVFVMDSVEHASEVALADAALDAVAEPRSVLVGGLGLGFTLDRVLGDRRVEHVDVVEIESARSSGGAPAPSPPVAASGPTTASGWSWPSSSSRSPRPGRRRTT
jgi:hypothetical protein